MQMIWRDRLDAMNIREIKFTTPSLTLHTNLLAPNANIWYAPTIVSCTILNDRCVWGSLAESTRNHRASIPPTSVFSPAGVKWKLSWFIAIISFHDFLWFYKFQACQWLLCVEKILIDQFVSLEFSNQRFYADGSRFIQTELQIYPVVGYWTIYDVVVVGKVYLSSFSTDVFLWHFRLRSAIQVNLIALTCTKILAMAKFE